MKFRLMLLFFLCVTLAGFAQVPTIKETLPDVPEEGLSDAILKDYTVQAKLKVEMFQNYLIIIADKDQPLENRIEAQKQAEELFIKSPEIYIEVSSLNSPRKRRYSVQDYLERIFNAQGYTKIVIEFYDSCRISDWKRIGPDKYEAIATIYQQFRGYFQGKLKYRDRTRKKVEVQLSDFLKDTAYDTTRYSVLLGNVTVEETMKVPNN